eukprot:m.112285 g.112285  ORF g.112285 m.112285 type:complete len:542 (+) comp28182_c0_seq3:407-2032(+)
MSLANDPDGLANAISDFIWDGSSVLTIAEVMTALRLNRPPPDTPPLVLTGADQITQAYKALSEFTDVTGKTSSGWRPSWESLGVSTRECLLPKREGAVCGIRLTKVGLQGAVPCHCITAMQPDSVGGNVGLACGDVILEVNGQAIIGQSLAYANALIVSAWLGGNMIAQVLPAAIAQVLLPQLKNNQPSLRRRPARPEQEVLQNVVLGLYYIPTSDILEMQSRSLVKPSKRTLGRLFTSPDKQKQQHEEDISNVQENRAKILRRALEYLTNNNAKFLVQEWLEVYRPALVQQFGITAVEENDHFLKELISSFHMGPPKSMARTSSVSSFGSDVDVCATPIKDEEVEVLRQESLQKAALAWEQEKIHLEDDVPQEIEYVYHDKNSEAEQALREETLSAAMKAWDAEKRRQKAIRSSGPSDPPQDRQNVMQNSLQGGDETEQSSSGFSPTKGTERSSRSKRSSYKAQVVAVLRAAEQSWQAEKSRLVSMISASTDTSASSIHMNRSSSGRVSSRNRHAMVEENPSEEPSTLPEPNRPWFGKPT